MLALYVRRFIVFTFDVSSSTLAASIGTLLDMFRSPEPPNPPAFFLAQSHPRLAP
ncbi:hypothetical protein FA95DRAFT_1293545 [Auriscalpium vulgare]|uniref:Uncharacterized protein n=1 Tax=Auriscalpium vulgare TaxID=40419 RepID=A0ACB8RSA4_9AGAM|nr:hypothetical protein FA95DRAFT_1293545 [Auriscalpium vulgare]